MLLVSSMTLDADSISAYPLLSIEIGGTKLQLFVGTREGLILARRRFSVEKDRGAEGIRECIKAALRDGCLSTWTACGSFRIAWGRSACRCTRPCCVTLSFAEPQPTTKSHATLAQRIYLRAAQSPR